MANHSRSYRDRGNFVLSPVNKVGLGHASSPLGDVQALTEVHVAQASSGKGSQAKVSSSRVFWVSVAWEQRVSQFLEFLRRNNERLRE